MERVGLKRGRSPCALGTLLGGTSEAIPFRKYACTLFNQGLRRRPIAPLNGTSSGLWMQNEVKSLHSAYAPQGLLAGRRMRNEECGLFNGALRQQSGLATGPCQLFVDKDGHVLASCVEDMVARQQCIGGRFLVMGEVGRGAFGVCLKSWDTTNKSVVAIKMVRRGHRHHVDAIMEAEKLQILRWRDRDHKFVVRVVSFFQYQGHFCLVSELLGINLHSALRDLRAKGRSGVKVEAARRLTFQLCEALQFLSTSRLIHADLKTENLCLARPGAPARYFFSPMPALFSRCIYPPS